MAMKKFINDPANLTSELLDGLVQCYPNQLALKNDRIVVRANPKPADKVAIVTLGGTGHEPALEGFVGEGMLDASVAGDIFAAPGGEKVFEALEMFNRPAGVLLVTLNHNGDRMSANKALRKAAKAGLNVKEIVIHEDIAQGPHAPIEDKRGLGGCIPFIKVVGAAAEEGKSLDEIVALGSTFNEGIATLSVALKTATHPQNGQEIGSIDEDKMEVGMGQHGDGREERRQGVPRHQRLGRHHAHGDAHRLPRGQEGAGGARRLGAPRQVHGAAHRPGDGGLPDDPLQVLRHVREVPRRAVGHPLLDHPLSAG